MIVHILADKEFTRTSFYGPGKNKGVFSLPTSLVSNFQVSTRKKLVGNAIKPISDLASRAKAVFFSGFSQSLDSYLECLSDDCKVRVAELPNRIHSIEWTFQTPGEIHPSRIFAMHGVVSTMSPGNRILIGLLNNVHIDVLQGSNHLGGISLDGLKEIRNKHFPETQKMLRPQNPKKVQPGNLFKELEAQIKIEGTISGWKRCVEESFFGGTPAEVVSYGEDWHGFRLFDGVSDFHFPLLDLTGCEWLCKKAYSNEKINAERAS